MEQKPINQESLSNLIKAVEKGSLTPEQEKTLAGIVETARSTEKLTKPHEEAQLTGSKEVNPSINRTSDSGPEFSGNLVEGNGDSNEAGITQLLEALQEAQLYHQDKSSTSAAELADSLNR